MNLRYRFKASFEKKYRRLSGQDQTLVLKTVEAIQLSMQKGVSAHGLGLKKLFSDPEGGVYEARAGLSLRILWLKKNDLVVFAFIGDHSEVRKYLKNF